MTVERSKSYSTFIIVKFNSKVLMKKTKFKPELKCLIPSLRPTPSFSYNTRKKYKCNYYRVSLRQYWWDLVLFGHFIVRIFCPNLCDVICLNTLSVLGIFVHETSGVLHCGIKNLADITIRFLIFVAETDAKTGLVIAPFV